MSVVSLSFPLVSSVVSPDLRDLAPPLWSRSRNLLFEAISPSLRAALMELMCNMTTSEKCCKGLKYTRNEWGRLRNTLETSGEHEVATLETGGEDGEPALETSGEDVKTTLDCHQ